MRQKVDFGIKNKNYAGVAKVENNRIDLCGPSKLLSWILACLGGVLGVKLGGALIILLLVCLGAYIGRSISEARGDESVYFSFAFQDVVKISHLVTNNRALYRVYVKNDPSNFVKIFCTSGTEFDSFMKTTFADVISEVDH